MRISLLLALTGCIDLATDKGGSEETTEEADGARISNQTLTSDSDGLVSVSVDVASGEGALLVTAERSTGLLSLEYITSPEGDRVLFWEDWYESAESLTEAVFPDASDTVVNYPIRAEDPALTPGVWTVVIGVLNGSYNYQPGKEVDVTTVVKGDRDFDTGAMSVTLVYADGLAEDSDVVEGTDAAIERWREIYAAYGIELTVNSVSSSLDTHLSMPGFGPGIDTAAELGTTTDVTVIIGEEIEGSQDYYGVAGSIPGTLGVTDRAAVVISWLANAGGDGRFSADDIRLYGETLAHEVGHYAGLYHPVEMSWDYWDALSDTDRCRSTNDCENELGDNLMFPYPVCGRTSCTPQDVLSDEQVGVAHRYTGTL
jgi:hypothetical protein